jgi:hypothetical protein
MSGTLEHGLLAADPGFYRTFCLEALKDLPAELRHLETISATTSGLSLAVAGAVFSFLVAHHDPSASIKQLFPRWLSVALIILGLLLVLVNLALFRRANDVSARSNEIISFLIKRGDLPVDIPRINPYRLTSPVGLVRRGGRKATHIFESFLVLGGMLLLWGLAGLFGVLFTSSR